MYDTSAIALAVLVSCLAITWLLGKARLVGTLTLTGFLLGALATAAMFVLLT